MSEIPLDQSTRERPDFGPTQVISPEELKVGGIYIRHFRGRDMGGNLFPPATQQIKILELPKPAKNTTTLTAAVKVTFPTGTTYEDTMSLSDLGVVPYENGGWSNSTWLEDPSKKSK